MIETNVPRPDGKRLPRVLNFEPGEKCLARFLADRLAVTVHYDRVERRGYPCEGKECRHCHLPKDWRAYIPALVAKWIRTGRMGSEETGHYLSAVEKMVVELRAGPAASLEGRCLRGILVELIKPTGARNQPLRVELLETESAHELPPAFDVRPTLCRLWGNPHAFDAESKPQPRPILPMGRTAT
jgi:hypothetical protein